MQISTSWLDFSPKYYLLENKKKKKEQKKRAHSYKLLYNRARYNQQATRNYKI
jgi:hypothetical protein